VQNETGGVDGRSEDISEGGMLVVCEGLLPQGQTARVRFGLPTTGRIVTCEAMIRWVKSDKANLRGRTAFGLEFTAIDEATRREIRRYTELMGDDPRG
jgi:c-di-GMP-binding flagellar brake protein YcgR